MKKIFLPIFILTWVLVLSGLWIIQPGKTSASILEYVFLGTLIGFFVLGIILAYGRIKREALNLPEEDELSKKVTQKTAAPSYYVSLFHWLVLIYIHSHGTINIDCLLSIGIMGMAIIFVFSWVIINNRTI